MKPDSFQVRLDSISDFAKIVSDVVTDYGNMSRQLAAADLTKVDPNFDSLLGVSMYAGSTEVNNAARDMLTKYAELYSLIRWAHIIIEAQLKRILTSLTETHQVYADVEAKQEAMFRGLLDQLSTGRTGGDDGTTGSR